jgi:hypothetical protein
MQLAREVNEAIAAIGRRFEVGDVGLDFFCECGAEACLERLSLTIAAFDGVRATPEPLLADGHPLVRSAEANARAVKLRDSASAVRAQGAHQMARAVRSRRTRGRV